MTGIFSFYNGINLLLSSDRLCDPPPPCVKYLQYDDSSKTSQSLNRRFLGSDFFLIVSAVLHLSRRPKLEQDLCIRVQISLMPFVILYGTRTRWVFLTTGLLWRLYFAYDNRKDHVNRELLSQRRWPDKWGFLASEYRQVRGVQLLSI